MATAEQPPTEKTIGKKIALVYVVRSRGRFEVDRVIERNDCRDQRRTGRGAKPKRPRGGHTDQVDLGAPKTRRPICDDGGPTVIIAQVDDVERRLMSVLWAPYGRWPIRVGKRLTRRRNLPLPAPTRGDRRRARALKDVGASQP